MRNISASIRQKVLKLYACMAMKKVYSTVHRMLLPWRQIGFRSLAFVKQNSFIYSLPITAFTTVHSFEDSYTHKYCISEVLIVLFLEKETEINILVFQLNECSFPAVSSNNILYTVVCTILIGVHVQNFNAFYLLFSEIFLIW